MSDDYDENKPEEAVSDYPYELEKCPSCGGSKIRHYQQPVNDVYFEQVYECLECGDTQITK